MAFKGQKPFSYRATKDRRIMVQFRGKEITILTGNDAAEFLEEAEGASEEELQFLMATVTGNFKHGNERLAKDHPRNK